MADSSPRTQKTPRTSKFVTIQNADNYNFWTVLFVSGGVLVLYSLSRIIALQRRVRDLEARPPVDDIVMRGMIRQQVSEMVKETLSELETRSKKETREFAALPIPKQNEIPFIIPAVTKAEEKVKKSFQDDLMPLNDDSIDAKIILSDLKSSLEEIEVVRKDIVSNDVIEQKPKRKVKKIVS